MVIQTVGVINNKYFKNIRQKRVTVPIWGYLTPKKKTIYPKIAHISIIIKFSVRKVGYMGCM
jgi:hypothetical protein